MRIETVSYTINWRKMRKGQSFFVPCINVKEARRTLEQVAERLDLSLISKVVIVDGVKGLRVWRM